MKHLVVASCNSCVMFLHLMYAGGMRLPNSSLGRTGIRTTGAAIVLEIDGRV